MKRSLVVVIVAASLAVASAAIAQQGTVKPAPAKSAVQKQTAMTNQDVVDLVKAGFDDSLIVVSIKAAPERAFDLSTKALLELKTAGVSQRLLTVMLGGADPGPAVPVTPIVPVQQIAVSAAPPPTKSIEGREAGIYLENNGTFTLLEPAVFSGGKTGGVFKSLMTYGIKKAKWKAVVRSPRAQQRIQVASPVFYFYFERQSSGLSNTGMMGAMLGASSPNEFVLAKMTAKSNERELIVGEFGTFGASSGTRSQDTVEITVERLQPGVYKVTPSTGLISGEYCFFYAAGASTMMSAGSGKLFDFGVDPGVATR